MNIFQVFGERIRSAIASLPLDVPADALSRIAVEPPRDASHGDVATNAAMLLAKSLGKKPRDLAEEIAVALRADADVEAVEVAGPGFINLRISPAFWTSFLKTSLAQGLDVGATSFGNGLKVNVEYVSANPTGPMHVGHCRGAVVGDALARLLAKAGFDVTKEYYINDAGGQIDVLARSAFLRYREALGEAIEIPEGLYPGDYLKPVGAALKAAWGDRLLTMSEAEWLPVVKKMSVDMMMDMIRSDLALLGVKHDLFFSEKTLHDPRGNEPSEIAEMIEEFRKRDLVYDGRLPPPKGQLPDDWEDREQVLFRSSTAGDDVDRPLVKSDGSYTYFAADVAYMRSKYQRGFKQMIFILGADHGGYVKRLEAVGNAISGGTIEVIVRLCQLVKLYRGGEPVKMSKRSGDFVTLADVVEEVGRDAVRFMMLMRKNDAPLDFDFVKVKEQSKDNPVFYVQYAHARCHSILRQAREAAPDVAAADESAAPLHLLSDPSELTLIRKLAEFPRVIDAAADSHEPHRVAFYLYELASDFHGHWNAGKENVSLRFVNPDEPLLTHARLALVRAVRNVLASGLEVLGVNAPEEMR
ncbi:arginine--tRNA ligase [Pleomorphomonas diazotrophica]|uniref:Arginine--tRNA ligase n=1 Tax=Pleomorphomonas diazotrophica TaxID=1166257 RepID=A0A1I4QA38_9HYPH|nr:arginine--tRNA ligase [Pleomorphomonas diazotrophica]PKR90855.1 arginine--tRNA ligase [Pleomorphomonas diazotrophica]SFM36513.1 arginyl-tRNA synthetase [Pleomorphomonas diazotrophica]